jgi:signal transduction histidine kinase
MDAIPLPENENDRLNSLRSYGIVDSLPEADLDELTTLASEICGTPIALISLIDDHRQWFKSHIGLAVDQTPKEHAFCAHAIMQPSELMLVQDARTDQRFALNPLVTGNPNIVFYAAVPLVNEDGFALGTLCVIDREPRTLNSKQLQSLHTLAKQVMVQLELRRKVAALQQANAVLEETNTFIRDFARSAAHDIKNPLTSILLTSQLLKIRLEKSEDEKSIKLVDRGIESAQTLLKLVNSMLDYSLKPELLASGQTELSLTELLDKIIPMMGNDSKIKITKPIHQHLIFCSAIALEQIFLNLLTNAIRYNDKMMVEIDITFSESEAFYHFEVTDNGIGIAEEQLQNIFEKHATLNVTDRFNQKGTGIGLASVKSLVDKLNGEIKVASVLGKGSVFSFKLDKNPLTIR